MDLNFCTYCDTRISHYSKSLYCSEECLKTDALKNHPLLGYEWKDFVDFPRRSSSPRRKNQTSSNFSLFIEKPPSRAHAQALPSLHMHRTTTITQPSSIREQQVLPVATKTTTSSPSLSSTSSSSSSLLYSPLSNSSSLCSSSPALTAAGTSTISNSFNSNYSSALPPPFKFDLLLSSNKFGPDNKTPKISTLSSSLSSATIKPLKQQHSFLFTSTMTMSNIS